MDWKDKIQVKKGNFGEKIINDYLEKKGFIVYVPITEKAHAFDRLAVKDKKIFIIAEIKTKAKLNYYNATGFDIKHYKEYKLLSVKYNIPVFVFFIDEMIGKIYGNWLNELEKQIEDDLNYPDFTKIKGVVLFSLSTMKTIAELTQEQIEKLKEYSSRNYNYNES